ncbi:hypothetical protein KAI87_04730, partial [Myxococcota bacterium]|nr:hypothetical protein [Myxococcota bacterium]
MAEKFNEAAVKKIERFQFWTLNGKGKVIGWFPIAKGMTYDNFIELHYDAKGVVIRIIETVEGYKNKVIRRPRFDAKGRIKYSERQGPDAGVNYRNNYEYDSNGLMVSRHEIDLDTDAMRWKINVKCDAKGNFLDQKYYGPEGDLKTHSVYEYNKNGRKTKQTKFLDGKEIGYFKFVLDEKDREVRRAWYSPDGDEKTSMLSTYNDLDLPIKTVFQDSNGVGKIAEISFTPQGKRIATQLKEKDGTLLKEMRILPDG